MKREKEMERSRERQERDLSKYERTCQQNPFKLQRIFALWLRPADAHGGVGCGSDKVRILSDMKEQCK